MSHDREPPHEMRLVYRGSEHRHRWQAECAVDGWSAVPTRRRKEAEDRYHAHVASHARKRARAGTLAPGRVTPTDDLPDLLRSGSNLG